MGKRELDTNIISISKQELYDLMKIAGKEAAQTTIEQMGKEREKFAKQESDMRYKNTKERLKGFRMLQQKVESELTYSETEQEYWRLMFLQDLMGDPTSYMETSTRQLNMEEADRRRDFKKYIMTKNALHLYAKDCEEHGKEVDQRRYTEMLQFYGIEEEPMLASELAEVYHVTEKAIYKDIGIATRIMSVYLFGTP